MLFYRFSIINGQRVKCEFLLVFPRNILMNFSPCVYREIVIMAIYGLYFQISRPIIHVSFIINLAHGEMLISRFYYIFQGCSNKKITLPLYQHQRNPFLIEQRRKSDNVSRFIGRRNNLSSPISLQRVAMFTPWRSQSSAETQGPIPGNSIIAKKIAYNTAATSKVLNNIFLVGYLWQPVIKCPCFFVFFFFLRHKMEKLHNGTQWSLGPQHHDN